MREGLLMHIQVKLDSPRDLENLIMALNESATSLVKFATTLAEGKDLQAYAESCYISYR